MSVAESMMLTDAQLRNLDSLIAAVKEDPKFLEKELTPGKDARQLKFATADVVTSCIYLVAHLDGDTTLSVIDVVGDRKSAKEEEIDEISRRVTFARNATLEELLGIRRKALGSE
jgi:hypothetical protein